MKLRAYRFTGALMAVLLAATPDLYAAAPEKPDAGTQQPVSAAAPSSVPEVGSQQETATTSTAVPNTELPDSPGSLRAKQALQITAQNEPAAPVPQQPESSKLQNNPTQQDAGPQSNSAQTQPNAPSEQAPAQQVPAQQASQPQNAPQQPAGAAAAQLGRTAGGAASKPAGAALAPAKQRQSRSLLIKLGLIAGAGVAVGTAMALSQASPSRPPGAH